MSVLKKDIFSSFSHSDLNPLNWSTTISQPTFVENSLYEKCLIWANLLETNVTSISERTSRFVEVLNQIFNVGNFNLFINVRNLTQQEQSALKLLLSPSGVIFSTIERFLIENNPKFDVRLSNFHPITQQKLKSGEVSDYFRCLFESSTSFIRANAFEYYFYRFTDHIYHRSCQDDSISFDINGDDCLYTLLLQEYFIHFLPIDRSLAPLLDDSQTNRNDLLDVSSSKHKIKGFGLLKRELYENAVVTPRPNVINAPSSAFLSKSWSFMQILSDVWLINAQTSKADAYLVILIRILIKHVYRFAFKTSTAAVSAAKLNEFKENIVERVLAPRMMKIFDYNYSKWPLDSSFRYLLELWLTFVQPWRCATDIDGDEQLPMDRLWDNFVEKHFVFYSRFLKLTFIRFIRTDLNASKNAASAYRVVKTFSEPNLVAILKNIDARSRNGSTTTLFDAEFYRIVSEFCSKMISALNFCQYSLFEFEEAKRKQTWTSYLFGSFGDDVASVRVSELTRTCQFLNYSVNSLKDAFNLHEINFGESDNSTDNRTFVSNSSSTSASASSLLDDDTRPECELDESGSLCLTPKGRFQIANKLCSFNFDDDSSSPIDMAPPRYNEIFFLVTFWNFVSSLINRYCGKNIDRLYRRSDIVGRLSSRLFYPPTSESWKRSPVSSRRRVYLPARLSLRYLASIRFCFVYILFLLLFWAIFSVSPFVFLFSSSTALILFVFAIAFI